MMMVDPIDDREDILSFSDYSINTCTADDDALIFDNDLFSLNSQSLNSIFYQDFDLFSQEWSFTSTTSAAAATAAAPNFPQDNIIFCGKVIILSEKTHQGIPLLSESHLSKIEINKNGDEAQNERPKKTKVIRSLTSKFYVDKIAVQASPREFRWYFLCGITKFRTEMGLKDMKDRQSRKNSSTAMFGLGGGGKKKMKKEFACKNEGHGMFKWHPIKLRSKCFSLNAE